MQVKSLRLQNFRSFTDSGTIRLDRLNVLVGENNSGKSSILKAINCMQEGVANLYADVRAGADTASVELSLENIAPSPGLIPEGFSGDAKFTSNIKSTDRRTGKIVNQINATQGNMQGQLFIKNIEPTHFIVPFLSKRKTAAYEEDVREERVLSISNDMRNLAAKLSRLSNPHFPSHQRYAAACKEILGFVVTTIPSQNGQRPGIYISETHNLPIDQMGEGVPHIVHLLASLAVSKNKLFLIEEPENDLHPHALKALLNLIIESSSENQFVISTHSNVVTTHLCSAEHSRLFKVECRKSILPTESKISLVDSNSQSRIALLQELGYSFSDFDLWDGWLILEESSAERIIRDYLIPWFAPRLSRIRTISAGGVGKVESTFEDLNRLVLFTHLQPAYKNKSWVRVDGDSSGQSLIAKLREKYSSWDSEFFDTYKKDQFERYYPEEFSERVESILKISEKKQKREEKRRLLEEVMTWLDADSKRAKKALNTSAVEIIRDLKVIESRLMNQNKS